MALEDAAPPVARVVAGTPAHLTARAGPGTEWLAIYNPTAGRSRRARAWLRIERELARAGLRFDVATTTAAGEASEIACAALRTGTRHVMVAGGDGTVHEVVNGLMRDATLRQPDDRPTLVPLPLGTGNDWARSLRLPRFASRAAGQCCTTWDGSNFPSVPTHLTGSSTSRVRDSMRT
jgi:hypothetical protein